MLERGLEREVRYAARLSATGVVPRYEDGALRAVAPGA
jgi:phosphosulfolactate phosphohydrolase-like enzyme